jgi:hypothetical protein
MQTIEKSCEHVKDAVDELSSSPELRPAPYVARYLGLIFSYRG